VNTRLDGVNPLSFVYI